MQYVIFTGGDFSTSSLSQKAIKDADVIIAADGGANAALSLSLYPTIIIGDMDSITNATKEILQKRNTEFITSSSEKDETDTELAINYAIEKKATGITILGGITGDRLDHIIANILLMTRYGSIIRFITGEQTSWVTTGRATQRIEGKEGDLLSLIPLRGDIENVTTTNLYYSLKNEKLIFGRPRGVSNVFTKNSVSVSFESGILLFVHTTHGAEE